MNKFLIDPSDFHIWNRQDLERYLVANQHNDIYLIVNEGPDLQAIGLFDLLDLFEFKSVTIETFNSIEHSLKYQIIPSKSRFKFFKVDNNTTPYQNLHLWNQNKIFSAFYNRPSWHRIGLASYLNCYHSDKTLLNFRYDPANDNTREEFNLNELFVKHPESIKNFVNCIDNFPIRLEAQDGYTLGATTKQHTDQLCQFYPNILIDIVAETFVQGQTFFVTEKTVRPMLLKKPFIAMAAQDHLLYLRQMGFRTFGNFWDEEYDGYANENRYKKIMELIDSLAKKSLSELEQMYQDMQHVLDHNYQLLVNQRYNTYINKVND